MAIRTTARIAASVVAWSCTSCGATPTAPAAAVGAEAPSGPATVSPAPVDAAEEPKAGAACKIETKELCISETQALACHDGRWEQMKCRGPIGCSKNGGEDACDQAVADDKEVCNLVNDYVCSSDQKVMLECTKHRWAFVQSCAGDRHCVLEQKKVTCDNSIATVGDACREEEDYACAAPDQKSALVCRGGKFVMASHCDGKNACRVTGDKSAGFKVNCDDSVATIGDACEKEGHYSCSPDAKQIVRCVHHQFAPDDKCKRREKCSVKGAVVGCY